MDWPWLAAFFYYASIYLAYIVAPAVPVVQSAAFRFRSSASTGNRFGSVPKVTTREPRKLVIGDAVVIVWMVVLVCSLKYLGFSIWGQPTANGIYGEAALGIHQKIGFIWHELLLLVNTAIFAWWWLRLKRKNVRNAFVFAAGGWLIVRAILHIHRSLAETGFNIASIGAGGDSILALTVALCVLALLAFELKRRGIGSNVLVLILALLLVVPQISKTHFLDAIYIMIIPSIAIAYWAAASGPMMDAGSGRSRIVAGLVSASSVAVAVLISGAVPLMIVVPNWMAGADVDETVILHLAAWTAPFIGSAAAYIWLKRISIDPIKWEWVALVWLILNLMAALWSLTINIELSGLAELSDGLLSVGLVLSVGVGALAAGVLTASLLLGRGAAIRPLFAASIWLAVMYAMTPLLAYSETPQLLKVLYSFELALTLAMVFFISSCVFGVDSGRSGRPSAKRPS